MKKTKEEILEIRNKLYDSLPKGQIDAFELIRLISGHVKRLDKFIDEYSNQEKQWWVKITSTETMPPYFEHVIVFGGEVHCRLFSKAWVALKPEEFVERTGISHWMPLPQKPEV